MALLDRLNKFLNLYLSVAGLAARPRLWLPFLIYAFLQLALLFILARYTHPLVYSVLSPLISLFSPEVAERFGHYPNLYFLLPTVFQIARLFVAVILEGLVIGLTSVMILRLYKSSAGFSGSIGEAAARWPQLAAGWVLITAPLIALGWYLPEFFADQLIGSPRRLLVFGAGLRLLTVLVYSVFIYALPAVIVFRTNALKGLWLSFRCFLRYPLFTFFLVFLPYLATVPISYMIERTDIVVTKFSPELVFYLLTAGLFVDMLVNFAVTAAAVVFLIEDFTDQV